MDIENPVGQSDGVRRRLSQGATYCILGAAFLAACTDDRGAQRADNVGGPSTVVGRAAPTDSIAVTNGPVSSTSAGTDTTLALEPAAAKQSIEVDKGTIQYELPLDATVDPRSLPSLPEFVIGYQTWFTNCCFLNIVIQSLNPPMPPDEAIGAFTSGGMNWTIYDTGPRDGTQIIARATGVLGTVLVGTQVRFPQDNDDPDAARHVAETVARSVALTPTD